MSASKRRAEKSSGSEPGKGADRHLVDDDDASFGARIGASISTGKASSSGNAGTKPRPAIQVQKSLVSPQFRPLSQASSLPDLDDDDLDADKLPQDLDLPPLSRRDLFWPIVGILSLVTLTGSFMFFLMVSRVPQRELSRRSSPSPTASASEELKGRGIIVVGDGNLPTPTPSPEASPSPEALRPSRGPDTVPTDNPAQLLPPVQPAATLPPARPPVRVTPPPVRNQTVIPPKIAATPVPPSPSEFKVLAGPYPSRSEAEAGSGELSQLEHAIQVQEDNGKFWLQLGKTFPQQDEALALAEQVVQRGHQVVVKKN